MGIKDLRLSIDRSLARARERVEIARAAVKAANADLQEAEERLAQITVDAERRKSAIELVEEMLEEVDRKEETRPYAQMNQDEAMRHALLKAQRTMSAAELAGLLKAGGYKFTSLDPANSLVVAANLNRKSYFSRTKEGKRTFIGLANWNEDGPPNPFEFLNDQPGDGTLRLQ